MSVKLDLNCIYTVHCVRFEFASSLTLWSSFGFHLNSNIHEDQLTICRWRRIDYRLVINKRGVTNPWANAAMRHSGRNSGPTAIILHGYLCTPGKGMLPGVEWANCEDFGNKWESRFRTVSCKAIVWIKEMTSANCIISRANCIISTHLVSTNKNTNRNS
jgi:hypothetical protein